MSPLVIAVLVGVAVYIAVIALLGKRIGPESTKYTRHVLQQLSDDKTFEEEESHDNISLMRDDAAPADFMARMFYVMPGTKNIRPKLLKAGLIGEEGSFMVKCAIVMLILCYGLKSFGLIGLGAAFGLTYLFALWRINRRITKRNNAFIDNFPDALDMIVRSVRSGYPLNSAVRMVADNMQPPVSTEFKQVADEIAYGSTLIESLQRLADRIDEPDVHFFVVVLTVQQDIGGNLSEVLNNLAGIIRKRKHLRMKIRAISSEGRTTAWVLGSMPFIESLLILLVNPDHLTPLFSTPLGNLVLGATLVVVSIGVFIVTRMVSIKV